MNARRTGRVPQDVDMGFECRHDSTRLDGWLDNCCLKCGADGYWQDGQRRDPDAAQERELHPSGKMLLRFGEQS